MYKLLIKLFICVFFICFDSLVIAQNINTPNIVCPMGVSVNSYTGNMFFSRNDIFIKGRRLDIDISFYYNSSERNENTGFGNGWSFNYGMKYQIDSSGFVITWNDGRKDNYTRDSSNTSIFHSPKGIFDNFIKYQAGKYKLITKNKMEYFFDDSVHKRLTKMTEPNGNSLIFSYTDSLLSTVTDGAGRSIQLLYSTGKLSQVIDGNGAPRSYHYSYDAYGNLIEVTDPMANKIKYRYIINGPISAITDKNNNTVDIIYNSSYGVKEVITCNTRKSISYNPGILTSFVVDYMDNGNNQVTSYRFDIFRNLLKKEGNCCGYNVSYEYDNNNNVSKMTDANGKEYKFTYDNNGNVLSETDPLGHVVHYTYEPNFNRLASVIDKNGNTTTYSYDAKGNLIHVLKPMNVSESYNYANNGDLFGFTDGRGKSISYTYDLYGYLTGIQMPLSVFKIFSYDQRGNLNSTTNARSFITTFTYDALNRLLTETDAFNKNKTFTYDANGNTISLKDKNGHVTSYSFDPLNRPVQITDALNHQTLISYDLQSNIIQIKDPNGNTTSYTYDNINRKKSMTNGNGENTQYSYDGNGNVTSTGFPNGNVVTFEYDALNRLIHISDIIGEVATYNYDNNGNKISETDGNNNLISYTFDPLNRIISTTNALGESKLNSYDENSNLTQYTDGNGHPVNYTYDDLNRKISITDALNYQTYLNYDAENNLISIIDANNHTSSFSYDALNRKITETYANNTIKSYTYDNNGNLISRLDQNGVLTEFSYDSLNRMTLRNYPGTNDDSFTYDYAGRMLSAVNNNAVISFSYDPNDRLINETLNGKVTSYIYNISGKKKTIQYPSGRLIEYILDERDRLISVTENGTPIANFDYDLSNRNTLLTYSNGNSTTTTYDAADRIISIICNPGGFQNYNYSYDTEGNKLYEKKNNSINFSERYVYDNINRLIDFKRGTLNGLTLSAQVNHSEYTLDGLGNRLQIKADGNTTNYSVNNINAYSSIQSAVNITPLYDANGNNTFDGTNNYNYDSENNLISVNSGVIAEYEYDALGRRIRRIVDTSIFNYYFDGIQIIEEYDSTNTLVNSYVNGKTIDQILNLNHLGSTSFYFYNSLGSVTALTNSNGKVIERYTYDPYGNFSIYDSLGQTIQNSLVGNRFFFTGREYDSEERNYHFRKRQYNPEVGRFHQNDPLGLLFGTNLYQYALSNPTNYIDPFGLKEQKNCNNTKSSYVIDLFANFWGNFGPISINQQGVVKLKKGPFSLKVGGNRETGANYELAVAVDLIKFNDKNKVKGQVYVGANYKPNEVDLTLGKVYWGGELKLNIHNILFDVDTGVKIPGKTYTVKFTEKVSEGIRIHNEYLRDNLKEIDQIQ